MKTFFCVSCSVEFNGTNFYVNKQGRRTNSRCKACAKLSAVAWQKANPVKITAKKFKVTLAEAERLLNVSACEVCGATRDSDGRKGTRLCIDHDHTTGRVRGVLCNNCNAAEGHLKTVANALKLAAYMERNSQS
jgi:hypothetical protein